MPFQPSPQGAHFDQLLTNYSLAFMQEESKFVAGQAFPVLPVANMSDRFRRFPRGAFMRDNVGRRPLGGSLPIAGFDTDFDRYAAEEQGLASLLDDRERANVNNDPSYDPERQRIRWLTQQHLIHRDKDWTDAYFKTGVWGRDDTGVSSGPTGTQFLQWDQANRTDSSFCW